MSKCQKKKTYGNFYEMERTNIFGLITVILLIWVIQWTIDMFSYNINEYLFFYLLGGILGGTVAGYILDWGLKQVKRQIKMANLYFELGSILFGIFSVGFLWFLPELRIEGGLISGFVAAESSVIAFNAAIIDLYGTKDSPLGCRHKKVSSPVLLPFLVICSAFLGRVIADQITQLSFAFCITLGLGVMSIIRLWGIIKDLRSGECGNDDKSWEKNTVSHHQKYLDKPKSLQQTILGTYLRGFLVAGIILVSISLTHLVFQRVLLWIMTNRDYFFIVPPYILDLVLFGVCIWGLALIHGLLGLRRCKALGISPRPFDVFLLVGSAILGISLTWYFIHYEIYILIGMMGLECLFLVPELINSNKLDFREY